MESYLGVEFMQDVFEVVTLDWFFGVEQLEELLHELGCDVLFESTDLDRLIDD